MHEFETGAGGLYTALILEDLGIPYHIIEARPVVGGRLMTYKFPDNTGAPYNYFDVGAMRFPKIDAMARVFKLFKYPPLNTGGRNLQQRLQPFYFKGAGNNNTLYSYNGVTVVQNAMPPVDPFKADQVIKDVESASYISAGTKAITDDVLDPFATRLLNDLKEGTSDGWKYLMTFENYSTRAYMSLKYVPSAILSLPERPLSADVVNWCETFDKSTGWYDRSLSETVLEAVAFGWQPGPNPPPTPWFCIDGGAQEIAICMADYIQSRNSTAITFNSRVTSIALRDDDSGMDVVTTGSDAVTTHQFSHVISTIPLPVLRTIDITRVGLSPMQSNALRQLNYGPSIKIGMQFKTAWWTTATDRSGRPLNIVGGQSYTDRPLRTIVYPSFGNVQAGKTTTLIASYCWTEDAIRMGALIGNDDSIMVDFVLKELADIHNLDEQFLRDQLLNYKGWNWAHDPLTMGAFAFFGPGKFENLYLSLNTPAAKGYFHFAGEAISVRHAWVEGALDSAWRAVHEMLLFPAFEKYREKFYQNWGMNPEWLKSSHRYSRGIPKVSDSLLYEHIARMHPTLTHPQGA
ncbi:amine oxidase [Leucogyrophana mollusca]|uniref:Amine oxidase n=1 Tax=Leucogyrophana mollusca TaxID=85980 RepID=A0ACB8BA70_9AGAM|nr:amine oxidase [Leucogyrophana mollusca]